MNSDFMIWMGNNISSDLSVDNIDFRNLVDQYVETRSNSALNEFLQSTPQIANWDEVDYGMQNGDIEWALKDTAFYAFDMFWPNALKKTYNYTFSELPSIPKSVSHLPMKTLLLSNPSQSFSSNCLVLGQDADQSE